MNRVKGNRELAHFNDLNGYIYIGDYKDYNEIKWNFHS